MASEPEAKRRRVEAEPAEQPFPWPDLLPELQALVREALWAEPALGALASTCRAERDALAPLVLARGKALVTAGWLACVQCGRAMRADHLSMSGACMGCLWEDEEEVQAELWNKDYECPTCHRVQPARENAIGTCAFCFRAVRVGFAALYPPRKRTDDD